MEKKKNNLIPVVIMLIVLVLGLGGFIVYDKVLNNEDNNVVDNNQENENNNNQYKDYNDEKLEKWLNNVDTRTLISLNDDYNQTTADDEFYSRFLGLYIMSHGRGAEPEIVDGKYKYCLNKNAGVEVIKQYFKVSKVNLKFDNIKDNNSILSYYEDKNNFCVLTTPTEYGNYIHELIKVAKNSQNQIEVLYALLGSYMNDENALSYYGYKKLTLEEADNTYKILKIETNLKEYN